MDDQLLKDLQAEYRSTIPEKMKCLKELLETVHSKMDATSLKNLKYELHKIAGSAGVYGFGSAGKLCKEFDLLIASKLQAPFDPRWLKEFDAYLEKIQEGFEPRNGS